MSDRDLRLLFVTSAPDQAADLVRALVDERLVACGNILPGVRSLYRWDGKVCDEAEAVIIMETAADRAEAAVSRIEELHAYDVPKIVVLDPESASAAYLRWVRAETRPT